MRMKRAGNSVGTCALSKLLSRHKLLVSDQILSSQFYNVGIGLLLLRAFQLGSRVSSSVVSLVASVFFFPRSDFSFCLYSKLQLRLFWDVSLICFVVVI